MIFYYCEIDENGRVTPSRSSSPWDLQLYAMGIILLLCIRPGTVHKKSRKKPTGVRIPPITMVGFGSAADHRPRAVFMGTFFGGGSGGLPPSPPHAFTPNGRLGPVGRILSTCEHSVYPNFTRIIPV